MKWVHGYNLLSEPTRNETVQGDHREIRTQEHEKFFKFHQESLRIIVEIVTGNFRLNYHLGMVGISLDTICRFCEKVGHYPNT